VEETAEADVAEGGTGDVRPAAPTPIVDVEAGAEHRASSGIPEFDRVLGGGLVEGSLVLLGGEPGIGKSTLLLQAAGALAEAGVPVLYTCGEESPAQVRMRAERLGVGGSPALSLLAETDVSVVVATALAEEPRVLVVDSIQTAHDPELTGAPGSVGQVRAATTRLMRLAKDRGVVVLVVGHVTKEGSIAGPRVLEHMVDTVLYFEGDRDHAFRVVRAVKNRFGSVSEIGVFEMGETGLTAVGSPSSFLVADRPLEAAGSVVTVAMEGSRPLLVEVQALVSPSYLETPRRLATGVDRGRLMQVLAVLEQRAGRSVGSSDVYVSVTGGIRVDEPACDLALAAAVASAASGESVDADTVVFGELGLTGEVRPVPHVRARLTEAAQLGFERAIAGRPRDDGDAPDGIRLVGVGDVNGALAALS
jgi:DNA repair protein RadA/Sms